MYRFNLQVLLDYRKRIEEGLHIELSQIQRALEKEKRLLLSYQREKSYYEEKLLMREEKEINVNEALLYRNYLRGMRVRIKGQREKAAKIKMDLDKKQEELFDATKKRKVLEKVKEKGWKRFMDNIQRRETLFIDEIGIRKYQRGN